MEKLTLLLIVSFGDNFVGGVPEIIFSDGLRLKWNGRDGSYYRIEENQPGIDKYQNYVIGQKLGLLAFQVKLLSAV